MEPNKSLSKLWGASVGRVFGMLTVTELIDRSPSGRLRVLTECECGAKKQVTWDNLISGNTKSCGCSYNKKYEFNRHQYYRKQYGYLSFVKYLGKMATYGKLASIGLFECKCGTQVARRISKVIKESERGSIPSSGCSWLRNKNKKDFPLYSRAMEKALIDSGMMIKEGGSYRYNVV